MNTFLAPHAPKPISVRFDKNKPMPLASLITLLFLVACSATPKLYYPPTQVDIAAPGAVSGKKTVHINILPRIGLFDDLLYSNQSDYLQDLSPNAQIVQYVLPERWVALFPAVKTVAGSRVPGCSPGLYTLCGNLNVRQAELSVSGFGDSPECRWEIDLEGKKIHSAGCSLLQTLKGNERLAGQVTVTSSNHPETIHFEIPGDRLVISLGDSYASGEGNPDRPIQTQGDEQSNEVPAVWMSRRCHRSAWAGPIRSALALQQPQAPSQNGVAIAVTGGMTILSAACSGAELGNLTQPGYPGRETIRQLNYAMRHHPRYEQMPLKEVGSALSVFRRLDSQITEVQRILNGRKDVEAVTLSIGGNDINFGEIVQELILEKKERLVEEMPNITYDIETLKAQFQDVAHAIETQFDASNVYLTNYPDPTRKQHTNGNDNSDFCSCLDQSFLGFSMVEQYATCMTAEKNKIASTSVVTPLNTALRSVAARFGWYFIEDELRADTPVATADETFVGHAWCASTQKRWIRTLADSRDLQGLLPENPILSTGAMHPTANGHELYMRRINSAFVSLTSPPTLVLDQDTTAVAKDGRQYVAQRIKLRWQPNALLDPATLPVDGPATLLTSRPDVDLQTSTGKLRLCNGARNSNDYLAATATCSLHSSDNTLDIGLPDMPADIPFALALRVRQYGTGKRVELAPVTGLYLDKSPPKYSCALQGPGWQQDCGAAALSKHSWLHGDVQMVLTADDAQSGFRRWNCAGALCRVEQDQQVTMRVALPEQDELTWDIRITPEDKVGNKTLELRPLNGPLLRIDAHAPTIAAIMVAGAALPSDNTALVLSNSNELTALLSAQDEQSGIQPDGGGRGCVAGAAQKISRHISWPSGTSGRRTEKLMVADCAWPTPNVTEVTLQIEVAPLRTNPKIASSDFWVTRINSHDEEIERFRALVLELSGNALDLYRLDDNTTPLAAAWLNLLDGRIGADAHPPRHVRLPRHCGAKDIASNFALLGALTACSVAANSPTGFNAKRTLLDAALLRAQPAPRRMAGVANRHLKPAN